jgi:hypothetical protein
VARCGPIWYVCTLGTHVFPHVHLLYIVHLYSTCSHRAHTLWSYWFQAGPSLPKTGDSEELDLRRSDAIPTPVIHPVFVPLYYLFSALTPSHTYYLGLVNLNTRYAIFIPLYYFFHSIRSTAHILYGVGFKSNPLCVIKIAGGNELDSRPSDARSDHNSGPFGTLCVGSLILSHYCVLTYGRIVMQPCR